MRRRLAQLGVAVLLAASAGSIWAGTPFFVDRTDESRLDAAYDAEWLGEYGGGGAVGDFDRDGRQDLFIPSSGESPDRLFLNTRDGSFVERGSDWGLTESDIAIGASVGDFDSDGWLDVFVTTFGPDAFAAPGGHHRLYRNVDGSGFEDVAERAGVSFTGSGAENGIGSCFGDHDLDGDLDLFVAARARSVLFRNNGDGTFTDVTSDAGLSERLIDTFGLSPRLVDMDGDRYPELLLAADHGTSAYFRNNRDGTFSDLTPESRTGREENGMGQTVGDFDRDGRLDWYVTSIHAPEDGLTGNKLYSNLGGHRFDETASSAGVENGGFGWGTVAVDLDHDGRLDLVETNGEITDERFAEFQTRLWLQRGYRTFRESALALGVDHRGSGRGLAHVDCDNDGDQDLLVFENPGRPRLYINELSGPDTHWIRVVLDTSGDARVAPDGYGSVVRVRTRSGTQMRSIDGGDNYVSKSELTAHFGLGAAASVSELRVDWPDGRTSVLGPLDADQTLTVRPPPDPPFRRGDVDANGRLEMADAVTILRFLFVAPLRIDCLDSADPDDSGRVEITDGVTILGRLFLGGPALPAPGARDCGRDPTDDRLPDCSYPPERC